MDLTKLTRSQTTTCTGTAQL